METAGRFLSPMQVKMLAFSLGLAAHSPSVQMQTQVGFSSGGSINRKLDCSARFGPSSDQSNLYSITRSLPSDNENKHDKTAAILKDTFDRQDTL